MTVSSRKSFTKNKSGVASFWFVFVSLTMDRLPVDSGAWYWKLIASKDMRDLADAWDDIAESKPGDEIISGSTSSMFMHFTITTHFKDIQRLLMWPMIRTQMNSIIRQSLSIRAPLEPFGPAHSAFLSKAPWSCHVCDIDFGSTGGVCFRFFFFF